MQIRHATPSDAEALRAIYAPYVEQTAITFEYDVPSAEEFAARISGTLEEFPYLVVEDDGRVLGYAYAGRLKARRAFDWAVETSIYLAGDARGRGIGRALHDALAKELVHMGVTNLYALVAATTDASDPHLDDGSIRFHEHMGYREAGRLSHCGYKFDRWYDLVFMELDVAAHTSPAPARHAFAAR